MPSRRRSRDVPPALPSSASTRFPRSPLPHSGGIPRTGARSRRSPGCRPARRRPSSPAWRRSTSAAWRGRRDVHATLRDERAVQAVWFNQPHLEAFLRAGQRHLFSGSVEWAFLAGWNSRTRTSSPRSALEGIPSTWAVSYQPRRSPRGSRSDGSGPVRAALDELGPVFDLLSPGGMAPKPGVPELREAMRERVHYPHRVEDAEPARRRMGPRGDPGSSKSRFSTRARVTRHRPAGALARARGRNPRSGSWRPFRSRLPLPNLGPSPRSARISDQTIPMRRLPARGRGLGQDGRRPGRGAPSRRGGYQAAILTPTTILAEQHAATASRLPEGLGVTFGLLCTASTLSQGAGPPRWPDSRRARSSIAIGTHALLERGPSRFGPGPRRGRRASTASACASA